MTIELVPLATIVVTLAEPMVLPDTPSGTRLIIEVTGVELTGERWRAHQKGAAAADWLILGPDGTGTLDVRATVGTDDGALIYAAYRGRVDLSAGPGEAPVYAAPLYETGDDRYRWLNKIQALAKGTVDGRTLTFEVYEAR